jgi:cold shock CspA family protein
MARGRLIGRLTGAVRFYDRALGYGFVMLKGPPVVDIYMNKAVVQRAGFEPQKGQPLLVTIAEHSGRRFAVKIRR